jgi:hypothetical protein
MTNGEKQNPSNAHRPLQIIPSFDTWAGTTDEAIREKIRGLQAAGLGGLVTNVSLENYLRSDTAWDVLKRGVEIAHKAGLRVWIYDEEGYPSGAAGGLVLQQYPAGEAQGLIRTRDAAGRVRYNVVTLYEATHATENFYKKRHYINILDPSAVTTFLAVTHDRYARLLEPIGKCVEAFFTDEPSLINAYIPKGKTYPRTLPWHPRLPEIFLARKGYDLMPHRERLFVDVDLMDRKVRCDFYEVVADLCAETYFGQLQEWCKAHGVASSGHLLGEETMVWQTDFDGSPFPSYRKFDIPGIDMILSDPEKIMARDYFMVPKIAGSATRLQGQRRLMCEISDFFGSMEGHPASMEQMQCTAGILFSFGVTDMLSYYPLSLAAEKEIKPTDFSPEQYRRYTEFVTRLHLLFSSGTISPHVAILYPITSVWAHFTPSDRSMYEPHPDPIVCQLDEGFTSLCRNLLQQQIDYDIVDERSLAGARVDGTTLVLGERKYEILLLPPADTVHLRTMEVIARFVEKGGTVLASPLVPRYAAEGAGEDLRIQELIRVVREAGALGGSTPGSPPLAYLERSRALPECALDPASPNLLCTTISKAEGPAYLLVNVSSREYRGSFTFRAIGEAMLFDPATGSERPLTVERTAESRSRVELSLQPFGSLCILFSDGH